MKKITLSTLAFLFATICLGQTDPQEKRVAEGLINLEKALDAKVLRDFVPRLASGQIPTTIPPAPSVLVLDNNIRDRTILAIKEGALLLADKYTLSDAFVDLAKNMTVVTPSEAARISLTAGKVDNTMKTIGGVTALAGIAYSALQLTGSSSSIKPKQLTMVNFASFIPAAINLFLKKAPGTEGGNQTAINQGLQDFANFAVEKGRRLAVHSFLVTEVTKSSAQITSLSKLATAISLEVDGVATNAQTVTLGNRYLQLLRESDTYYSGTVKSLREAVSTNSNQAIYDDTTAQSLRELAEKIDKSISAWNNVRYLYTRSEKTISDGLAEINKSTP